MNSDDDNDDKPVGRILSRREVLALLGLGGTAAAVGAIPLRSIAQSPTQSPAQVTPAGDQFAFLPFIVSSDRVATTTATPSPTTTIAPTLTPTLTPTSSAVPSATATRVSVPACVVSPALTEGPYFVDELLNRSDIRSDPTTGVVKDGALLQLTLQVSQVNNSCAPLAGAMVDLWHCDALGTYSDVSDQGFNTVGQKFLRGYQVTDSNGLVTFTTIYPGWYQGRAVHMHFKIRATNSSTAGTHEFTSQFFFNEATTDQVHAQHPYASKGQRTLLNSGDGIYNQGGSQLVLPVAGTSSGYAATFDIGMQL